MRAAVKGTLRETFRLDHCIAALSRNGLKGMKSKTRVLLRLGIYLLDHEESMPQAVCIHETVELARRTAKGSHGFVNAILRAYLREKDYIAFPDPESEEGLSVRYSINPALLRLILDQYGNEEGLRLIRALNEPCETGLRVNLLRADRQEVLQELLHAGAEVRVAPDCETGLILTAGNVLTGEGFRQGRFSVQGIASQQAIAALDPQPGSRVLDLCAAPGGKTAAAAERMQDTGELIACDLHPHRTELIERNAERLGLRSVRTLCRDALLDVPEWAGQFDSVLADVPCTGFGTIPAKPEIKLRFDPDRIRTLTAVQKQILEQAWRYVRPGGRLLYATCTFNREENEGITAPFLSAHPEAETVEMKLVLPYNKTGLYYHIIRKVDEEL